MKQSQPIPIFRHDFIITKNFSREIVRTVIHAILFHRVLGSVQPKEVEVLGITFPQIVETEIEKLVNERTERVALALEHKTSSALILIRVSDTRTTNHADGQADRSWFKSSSSSPNKSKEEDDSLVWERWEIGFRIRSSEQSHPSSSPKNTGHHLLFNPIGYLSAKSDNPTDHLQTFRSIQHQLNEFNTRLIEFVLSEREHVPAITNGELIPFPVDISILPMSLVPSDQPPVDVYFVDQLSASIPLLRYATRTRVLFYCHFPDLLLSPTSNASSGTPSWISTLKSIYRIPLDWLEEYTTANADTILVNSQFTAEVFRKTLTTINKQPKVVYPGVDINIYNRPDTDQSNQEKGAIYSERPTILSINRFEEKKNINLILQAFIHLREGTSTSESSQAPRLVLAGGYDERLMDNRRTLKALQEGVPSELSYLTLTTENIHTAKVSPDVLFLLNVSQEHKLALLHANSTKLLGYTASNEHLGIGPLEAMACRLPVLAVDSGGPRETVSHTSTGFLVPPDPEKWARSIQNILAMDDQERAQIGNAGRERVVELFSTQVMAKHFERAIVDILSNQSNRTDIWLERGFFHLLAVILIPILSLWIGARISL
ncbi:hypothetical protein PSTG_14020 [Puccinia striiformis f. sp. tritici PST-78]|uniref:Alpha-1,3/1,6-mannosyltransferase ALG2 n=1 Tax=Puccinia striiformis f. sp. tritici PST-78 TaxID=1165861 RepID=A0A0L0UZX2_9BASI|nr:hypothetical protein PSTG_14020 [Puccinia striiformis f. sp. tritici PST-78]